MSDKKSRPPKRAETFEDVRTQRTAFVSTFFKKGAELTEELLKENERLRTALRKAETDNAALRTQLRSDDAIREALKKIDQLEKEKEALLSQFSQAEAVTNRFTTRYSEIEEELANLANLYVASYQLHSAIRLPTVVQHLRELLAQLVGARSHAVFVVDEKKHLLVPISSDGVDLDRLPRVPLAEGVEPPKGGAAVLERVFLTGVPHIEEGDVSHSSLDSPAACLPMRIEERAVGVIAVYELLPQKERFVAVDFELFKMLAAHAATALVGAMLYAHADGKLPGVDVFRDLPARDG
ncbi:MAG: GAF domain-containing protein [Polyangiaceae bacterium]|jgi:GAF domain-containing protein